jgi:hypothetical protein
VRVEAGPLDGLLVALPVHGRDGSRALELEVAVLKVFVADLKKEKETNLWKFYNSRSRKQLIVGLSSTPSTTRCTAPGGSLPNTVQSPLVLICKSIVL